MLIDNKSSGNGHANSMIYLELKTGVFSSDKILEMQGKQKYLSTVNLMISI
uniref:OTU-like cysteine protease family protein n=1 Tax=Rhizophora mucronata TaxID=61149 RepID=A0A2P2NH19_RHIMU